MAIDPVCGMQVNEATAKNVSEFAGSKYFFCGAGCKRKFDADPDSYLCHPAKIGVSGVRSDSGHGFGG